MKINCHIIWYIFILAIGMSGCQDNLEEFTDLKVEEGIPVSVSIDFSTARQSILTKVEQKPETEYNVSTIYLLAFNSRGEKTGGQAFHVGVDGVTGTYKNESFSGEIKGFEVTSGMGQNLYAIANYDNNDYEISKSLDDIKTEEELEELQIKIRNDRILLNRISFIMAGVEQGVTITPNGTISTIDGKPVDIELKRLDAKITFNVKADIEGAIEGTLEFIPKSYLVYNMPVNAPVIYRGKNLSDAKFASMDANSTDEDKAPVTVFDEITATGFIFNFYMLENYSAPPEKGGTGGSGIWIDATAKEEETNAGIESLYALREKEEKEGEVTDPGRPGMTERNIGFKYAPKTATYVEINGELSYQRKGKDGSVEYVNVSARYTIHLGETGRADDANNEYRVNNYTTARNTHYTYNITLTGINSYDAEVNSDQEVRPGAEGDVIIAGDQVRAIDSHYSRTRIKFTRKALQEGLSWIIQTPFDQGMKLSDNSSTSLKDYKWVLFAVNREFGVYANNNTTMVKFPGYEAYDGGAKTLTENNSANEDEGNSPDNVLNRRGQWKDNMTPGNYYYNRKRNLSDDACLRDVNQLINHLSKLAKNDDLWKEVEEKDNQGNDVVYVTAFVDEYVYVYNPVEEEYKVPDASISDQDSLLLWKNVVNGTDRLMHICTSGAVYSPDGESSWSNSVLTIRQAPIYSIYNEKDAYISQAWGTESILETPALPIKPENSMLVHGGNMNLTMDNGRYNTLSIFGSISNNGDYVSSGIKWTDVLSRDAEDIGSGDDQKEDELQERYRDVWHACMTRNRDLDGDNIIDQEEIRWVMASIDELTDLWIGQNALPQTAYLYHGNGDYMEHVVSSSGTYDKPWIIWAEEGASRGQYNDDDYTDHESHNREYQYRCIRYLGIPLNDITVAPEDYVRVTKSDADYYGASYRIDLSKLDYSARRSSSDGGRELPLHYERGADGINQPYRSFEMLVYPYDDGNTSRRWETSIYDSESDPQEGFEENLNYSNISSLCPPGYRVPNQRELMLMFTSVNSQNEYDVQWSDSFWCSTHFSYSKNGKLYNTKRPGFATSGSNLILVSTGWYWDSNNKYVPQGDNIKAKVRCVRDVE